MTVITTGRDPTVTVASSEPHVFRSEANGWAVAVGNLTVLIFVPIGFV